MSRNTQAVNPRALAAETIDDAGFLPDGWVRMRGPANAAQRWMGLGEEKQRLSQPTSRGFVRRCSARGQWEPTAGTGGNNP